jgi:hypothetical protein
MTHEEYVGKIRDVVASTQPQPIAERLRACKLVYGIGDGSYRGICYYDRWQNGHPQPYELVEVAASGEEDSVQLAGTTVHELAHVLAGKSAGHGKEWKHQADLLGLRLAKASGHVYLLSSFRVDLRHAIAGLASKLADGKPTFAGGARIRVPRPCSLGIGTRGGTSRGPGSGSRLRLWVCQCQPVIKVRIASDDFRAHCDRCGKSFTRAESEGR